MERQVTVVTVTLEDRPDGGLRVYSDDLPGLILSGKSREAIGNKIVPAIQLLFAQKGYKDVIVRPVTPIDDVLKTKSPRDLDMHVHHEKVQKEQFVVELPMAA